MSNEAPFEPVEDKTGAAFDADAPVTGKAQMQAAWSADDGEEAEV